MQERLNQLWDMTVHRSVPANKVIVEQLGTDAAVVFGELLSRQIYFTKAGRLDTEGYFFNSREDLRSGTGLGRKTQERVIKKLIEAGLLRKKNCYGFPRFFKIDEQGVENFYNKYNPVQKGQGCSKKVDDPVQNGPTTRSKTDLLPGPKGTTNNYFNNSINNTLELWNQFHVIKAEPNEKLEQLINSSIEKHGDDIATAIKNYRKFYNPNGKYYSVKLSLKQFLSDNKFKAFLPGGEVYENMQGRELDTAAMTRKEMLDLGLVRQSHMTREEQVARGLLSE